MTVLIAEDDALVAMCLTNAIAACGEEVIGPAPTMDEALQMAASHPPEFGFIGYRLRDGKTGEVLARVLRETFGTTVFLITADPSITCESADAPSGILRKPYPLETIAEVLAIARKMRAGESVSVPDEGGIEICRAAS